MSMFSDHFNSSIRLRCDCGQHAWAADHDADRSRGLDTSSEGLTSRVVEQAVTRATMHHDPKFYECRNHLIDFLVHRSKTFATA